MTQNLTQNWDKNGNIYYTNSRGDIVDFNVNPFSQFARNGKAALTNIGSYLSNSNPHSEAYKEKAGAMATLLSLPLGLGEAAGQAIARAVMPVTGKKIAQGVAQGISSGIAGGAVEGAVHAGLNDENVALGALKGGTIGGLMGGAGGYGLGKTYQQLAKRGLKNNPTAQEQYFNDFIADLENKTKAMAEYRGLKQGAEGLNSGDNLYDIDGHYSIDDFDFVQHELPRSLKHRYYVETIDNNDNLPKEIVQRLKKQTLGPLGVGYLTKDGTVYSNKYVDKYTKNAVEKAIVDFNQSFNKKAIKEYINSDLVKNYHKNKNLEFLAEPESKIISEQQFYKSPVHNNRQSSSYSVALDNDGNIYYKRKSNHWGDFYTNKYADDVLNENSDLWQKFKEDNPQLDKNDFLESLGYDTSDVFGRVGTNGHSWNLKGGDVNSKKSQTGYIKIGNINDDFKNKLAKDLSGEFDYEKAMKLSKDLKSGKKNLLRKQTKSDKIEDIQGISSNDMEYLRHELNNNLTSKQRSKKYIKKPVGDYIYKVKNNGFDDYNFIEGKPIDDIYN